MPFLMHIAFDNPFRLKRNVHYFEYGGVRFKLLASIFTGRSRLSVWSS